MSPPNSSHIVASRALYIFAWIVEGIAVAIGLAISLSMSMEAFLSIAADRDVGYSDYLNVGIAALPFVLVAIVELTKIPMAGAFYNARTAGWRLLFLFVLVFLAGITFETAFNGFERNFTNLKYTIEKQQQDLIAVDEELAGSLKRQAELQELTAESIEDRYNQRHQIIVSERDQGIEALQTQKNEIRATAQSDYIEATRSERDELISTRETLREERGAAIQRAVQSHDQEVTNREERQDRERQRVTRSIETREAEISRLRERLNDTVGIFSGGQREQLQEQIEELSRSQAQERRVLALIGSIGRDVEGVVSQASARYDNRIASVSDQIEQKNREISRAIAQQEQGLRNLLEPIDAEIARINEVFNAQQSKNESERERQFANLAERQQSLLLIEESIQALTQSRLELRDGINRMARGNQVYRITQSWTGADSAADLKPDEVALTALVWFGSLAMVVAVTGIVLALASHVLRSNPEPKPMKDRALRKLIDSARRMLIFGRTKLRTKIVKVPTPGERERVVVHTPIFVDKELAELRTTNLTEASLEESRFLEDKREQKE